MAVDRNGHCVEFVSEGCKGLNMSKEFEEYSAHVLQARWFAERLERMNEALAQFSGVFIGFLGIELVLLGQSAGDQGEEKTYIKILASLAAILLVLAISSYLIALWSGKFLMPSLLDLRDSWSNSEYTRLESPLRILTDENGPAGNILKSLYDENAHLNRYYRAGIILAGFSQLVILSFVLARWFIS